MVEDNPLDCPVRPASPSDSIMLSFKVVSSNISTRADGQYHPEVGSAWKQFEDLIDLNDFAFYIFLESAPNKPLIMRMTDIAKSTDPNSMVTGAYGAYTVTTVIPKLNLEKLLGYEIAPGSETRVDFRLVLLANTKRVKGQTFDYDALAPTTPLTAANEDLSDVTTFEQFMTNANQIDFNFNDSFYSDITNDSEVGGLYKEAIPMFGMLTASATEDELYTSRPEERIRMGEVLMLRSVAKIEVIDNAEKDANGYPYVESVRVEGLTNMAYQLPSDAAHYVNGQQVHTLRWHPASGTSTDNNSTFALGYLNATNPHAIGTVRFGYLPEQDISQEYAYPVILVTARLDVDRTETYAIPMGGNADYPLKNSGGFGNAILRNHIYSLSINSIAVGTPAEITVNVAAWQTPEYGDYNLDFTNTLVFPNKLRWLSGVSNTDTYLTTGNVVATPWTTNSEGIQIPVPLVCDFGFQSPLGATWQAYLVGDNGAFRFVDAAGAVIGENMVEGTINNSLTTLRIVTTDPAPQQQFTAKLQIVVLMPDGSVIEAHSSNSDDYENFTIIQEAI